jgi:hypothetical protein
MTIRERILSVYRGTTLDVVPFMLDLSHWFYHRRRLPWDLSQAYIEPEYELLDYHKRAGVGFYLPNLGAFYNAEYGAGVQATTQKLGAEAQPEIAWRLETARGGIERRRIWEPNSYSWAISKWGVATQDDLRILAEALSSRTYAPLWDRYYAWIDAVGDYGVVYMSAGYSALGQLLHYWMGVERTLYALVDWPETMREIIDRINANNLKLIDLLATSPAEIILMGDNFSADIQPQALFTQWSRPYYAEAIRRLHAAGKKAAVHVDGRLRGALRMIADAGADCIDAVTPTPMGDLSAQQCRDEVGTKVILSGGVSPNLWLPSTDEAAFITAVRAWLDLHRQSPRLIANAGDQVPPGAEERRISLMCELVEKYGQY